MNNEEKAIEVLNTVIETRKFSGIYTSIDIIFEAIETILKLYEDKKEEAIAISKSSYMVGVLDERNEWYKKIKETLGIEEDISEEKFFSLLETLMSEVDRLEDIEDRKVEIEYELVFNKGVKSVENKIIAKIEKLKEIHKERDFTNKEAFYLDCYEELLGKEE